MGFKNVKRYGQYSPYNYYAKTKSTKKEKSSIIKRFMSIFKKG